MEVRKLLWKEKDKSDTIRPEQTFREKLLYQSLFYMRKIDASLLL